MMREGLVMGSGVRRSSVMEDFVVGGRGVGGRLICC